MAFDVAALLAGTTVDPRPYQQRIIVKAVDGFTDKGLRSIMIDSPTASGKTVLGLLIAKAMQEKHNATVGWASMRRNLLTQAERENEAKGIGVRMHMISMFDKHPPPGLDMLVVDEAQHDAAGSMGHIHAVAQPKWTLGMTATPFRGDRVKLCFDTVIRDAGIHRLIQDGYLSPYHHYTIPDWKPDTVAEFYLRERERWGKSLMYFHTLKACFHCWQLLCEGGVACDVVTGDSDCESQIEDFRTGKLKVLVNCAKLTEGFDSPDLQTVFARPSIKSVTVQMGGRVFRKYPTIPFKQIVQSADTKWPFTRTAGPALMFVHIDGNWRTIQPNCQVEEVSKRALVVMAASRTELPAYVTKQTNRRLRRGQRRPDREGPGNYTPSSGVPDATDEQDARHGYGGRTTEAGHNFSPDIRRLSAFEV